MLHPTRIKWLLAQIAQERDLSLQAAFGIASSCWRPEEWKARAAEAIPKLRKLYELAAEKIRTSELGEAIEAMQAADTIESAIDDSEWALRATNTIKAHWSNKCAMSGCPGWAIFNEEEDGGPEIQKCDECDVFETDEDAARLPEAQQALREALERVNEAIFRE